jgi:hypothetical protein
MMNLYAGVMRSRRAIVFDPESFVSACREALAKVDPAVAVQDIVAADL